MSYGVVAIIIGFLRELFANGTIWDISINMPVKLPAFMMPFGGLLILGFLAAALKAFINHKYPEANPDKGFDTSEIRRSLRGKFTDLMRDEFNPYGDAAEEPVKIYTPKSKNKKEKKTKNKHTEQITDSAITGQSDTTITSVPETDSHTYLDEFS